MIDFVCLHIKDVLSLYVEESENPEENVHLYKNLPYIANEMFDKNDT